MYKRAVLNNVFLLDEIILDKMLLRTSVTLTKYYGMKCNLDEI